jgi:hypothetical protein
MPFFVLAGLILITLPVCICILPKTSEGLFLRPSSLNIATVHTMEIYNSLSAAPSSEKKENNASLWKFLKIPAFDIVGR